MKAKQQTTSQNKQYNMWQNMIYAYHRVAKVYPMMIVFTIFSIVLSVLLPVINNVLPALVVAMIEQGSIRRFLLMLAILGVVTAGGKWMLNYSNRETEQYITSFRFQTMILEFYDKVMRTGYHNVEPHQKQIDFQNAFSALNGDNWGIGQIFRKAPLFFFHLIGLIMYAGILSTIDWKILLVLFAMTVSCLIFERISYRYQQKTRKEEGEYHQATYYLGDYCSALENAKDIRLYGIENWFPQRFEQLNQKIKKLSANIWGRMKLMDVSNNLFLVVRDLLAYGILIGQVLDHTLSVAEFTFYVGMIAGFTTWLTGLVENYGYLRKASLQLGYLRNYMEMEDGKREKSGTGASLSYPLSIEFKDVSFTYPQTEKPVLEHLNLTIRPGEKIALVGQNGAGKTTLVKLLTGLYQPSSGEILLGGRNIQSFSSDEYFELIGTVFQDPFLMAFSIEQNIACCDEEKIDHQRVKDCLKRAGLWEKIESLPKKEKTPYSKDLYADGVALSGGEIQKMMLARALYKDAPVMVLDEPTAALDPLAEADMYQKYHELTKEKTSVFISHRLSSTQFCDRVFYLENGKIVEEGTHQQLMQQGGQYAKMFAYQAYYYQKKLGAKPDEE